MKKFLTIFFVTLGVIFFGILCLVAYLWFADPFGLRPLFTSTAGMAEVVSETVEPEEPTATSVDKNPNLTPAQEDALTLIGIDPAGLPSEVSQDQYSCFVRVLGEARVLEIKAGEAPTPIEIFKAKECLQ